MAALVTGGGTGIGRALAEALAADQPVAVAGRRDGPLTETVRSVEAAGGRALAVPTDLGDRAACRALVARVTDELGPVDVLVNNAGTSGPGERLRDGQADAWQQVLTVNVLAAAWLCAEVVPGMVARGRGAVLNVNSLQASRSFPGWTAYGASKAALMRLTDGLANEVEGTGVLVADVSPGLVDTDMTSSDDLGALLAGVPAEEWTPVEKVVAVVRELLTREHDVLHGRFVHAEDDVPALAALVADADDDARRLRMTPLRPDPLLD